MDPEQITIAVTVYSRRQYLKQAISSALNQTRPVRVFVMEDCGPDPEMEAFVKKEFPEIRYYRNKKRRGIFGNWNSCLDVCETEWMSILHDDDFLAPTFVESMIELAERAPGRGLYFGHTGVVDEQNNPMPDGIHYYRASRVNERGEKTYGIETWRMIGDWMPVRLDDVLYGTPFQFPGQLFPVKMAKKLGGFRDTSLFCGDWEMWTNLIAETGGARTGKTVTFSRSHTGWDRGCTQIVATGRHMPLTVIQHKRVLALMRRTESVRFDRISYLRLRPESIRFFVRYGTRLPPRLFGYHYRLLLLSPPPNLPYALFQMMTKIFGVFFIKAAARIDRLARP